MKPSRRKLAHSHGRHMVLLKGWRWLDPKRFRLNVPDLRICHRATRPVGFSYGQTEFFELTGSPILRIRVKQ